MLSHGGSPSRGGQQGQASPQGHQGPRPQHAQRPVQPSEQQGPSQDMSGQMAGLNLQAAAPRVTRQDSSTSDVDEFVDAKQ